MTNNLTAAEGVRRPYTGSCHCGFTKYIVYLTFPPTLLSGDTSTAKAKGQNSIRLRKCNCTVCQKTGFFHVRTIDAGGDFLLLSPLDPLKELNDYTTGDKKIHLLFCGKCGVRCIAFAGKGEVVEREIDGEKKQVWKPVDGLEDRERGYGYLSVNAHTLDAGQEGLDLREWYDKHWMCYLDMLDGKEANTFGRPHRGGTL